MLNTDTDNPMAHLYARALACQAKLARNEWMLRVTDALCRPGCRTLSIAGQPTAEEQARLEDMHANTVMAATAARVLINERRLRIPQYIS